MRKNRTMILLSVVAAVLFLGIVYAAISNITLNITGNVVLAPEANFKVAFIDTEEPVTPIYEGDGTGVVKKISDTSATIDVSGLKEVDQGGKATFTIKNLSNESTLTAYLSATITTENNTEEYISTDYTLGTTTLAVGSTTTLDVSILVKKLPTTDTNIKIYVNITASPEETTGNTITGGNTISCNHEWVGGYDWQYYDATYHAIVYQCANCSSTKTTEYEAHMWTGESCSVCGTYLS